MSISRRIAIKTLAGGAAAVAMPAIVPAQSPLDLKCGNIMPAQHPVNIRLAEALSRISERTNRQVNIKLFPSSQLGADDSMLSQLRSGALEFFIQSGLVTSSLVSVASLNGVGFIFPDYPSVWKAMDGPVGAHIIEGFRKANLIAFDRIWDNGFRQMTSSTKPIDGPEALQGMKMRVPPSALWTSMLQSLGASPVTIPWAETYTSLQTGIADGQETPLAVIHLSRIYEVQKFLSMTNHMWDGLWFLSNRRVWDTIPAEFQSIIRDEVNQSALEQRADVAALNDRLKREISSYGLRVIEVKPEAFRAKLQSSGFYAHWKERFGAETWAILESSTGPIV
jgi:tripartite ATP-independent transporter DctP family solute receptor